MIMTVITQDGKLAAAAAGDMRWSEIVKQPVESGRFRAGVSAGPGQTIHVVEVPDGFGGMYKDPSATMAELTTLLVQRGLL